MDPNGSENSTKYPLHPVRTHFEEVYETESVADTVSAIEIDLVGYLNEHFALTSDQMQQLNALPEEVVAIAAQVVIGGLNSNAAIDLVGTRDVSGPDLTINIYIKPNNDFEIDFSIPSP